MEMRKLLELATIFPNVAKRRRVFMAKTLDFTYEN